MSPDQDEGFRVTDRRGREGREPVGRPAAQDTAAAQARHGADEPRRETLHQDLRGLFLMLATEAMIAIGDSPDPASGQVRRDLAAATDLIDLLLLLRQKTEGNRNPEETRVLDDLIYDLQMRFVRATKSSTS